MDLGSGWCPYWMKYEHMHQSLTIMDIFVNFLAEEKCGIPPKRAAAHGGREPSHGDHPLPHRPSKRNVGRSTGLTDRPSDRWDQSREVARLGCSGIERGSFMPCILIRQPRGTIAISCPLKKGVLVVLVESVRLTRGWREALTLPVPSATYPSN